MEHTKFFRLHLGPKFFCLFFLSSSITFLFEGFVKFNGVYFMEYFII